MKRFAIPLTVAALFATTVAATPRLRSLQPKADVVENYTLPSAIATVNPCNDDAVPLVGTLHFLVHATTSENGNIHGYYSFTGRYDGVGVPSGLKYQGREDYLDDYTITNGAAFVETISQDFALISQTSAYNYTLRVHFKITINANGVPTAEVTDFTTTCGG